MLAALAGLARGAGLGSLAGFANPAALANVAGIHRMMRFVLIQYAEWRSSAGGSR